LRLFPIEAAGAEGTGGHAVPATDAAVLVHGDHAVAASPGGLGRADARARRVLTVIAQNKDRRLSALLTVVTVVLLGKDPREGLLPNPFDFVPGIRDRGNFVRRMARIDARPTSRLTCAAANIDGDTPLSSAPPCRARRDTGQRGCAEHSAGSNQQVSPGGHAGCHSTKRAGDRSVQGARNSRESRPALTDESGQPVIFAGRAQQIGWTLLLGRNPRHQVGAEGLDAVEHELNRDRRQE